MFLAYYYYHGVGHALPILHVKFFAYLGKQMYWLYKDPNGENIFIHTTTNNELPKTGVSIIEDLQNEVNYLRSKLKVRDHQMEF